MHGRDEAALSAIRSEIAEAGGRAIYVVGDVTRLTDLEAMRERVERELGPVEVLVANAGGNPVPPRPLEEISEEGFRASVDANLTATFLTLKTFLPGMKQRRRGSIVTVSSAAARRPSHYSPIPYAAAKAGIELLTQDVAAQAGPFGVRVNCIAPETILTEPPPTTSRRRRRLSSSPTIRCGGWARRRTSPPQRCSSSPKSPGGSPA